MWFLPSVPCPRARGVSFPARAAPFVARLGCLWGVSGGDGDGGEVGEEVGGDEEERSQGGGWEEPVRRGGTKKIQILTILHNLICDPKYSVRVNRA